MAAAPKSPYSDKFAALCQSDIHEQVEFFLKSFIFALGDDWKNVVALSKHFQQYLKESAGGARELDSTQAADFLQKNGKTRTALQRRNEVRDVDLDFNEKLSPKVEENLCLLK
jgi:hypothetical protein